MTKLSKTTKNLLLASFIGTFAEQMLMPFWSAFTQKVGGDVLDAGIGFAIFCIITGIFIATVGQTKWFEKNTRKLLVCGFAVATIGDFLYLLVNNKWELFAVQAIIGISVGILNTTWDSLFAENNGNETSSQKWSLWNGGIQFVLGVSALVGGLIVTYFGFKTLFWCQGIVDIVSVYFAYKAVKK
jgi:predicted MFS family arabinose efflux permease